MSNFGLLPSYTKTKIGSITNLFFGLVSLDPISIGTITTPIIQKECAIAIGKYAGIYNQGTRAIAIGDYSGNTFQGSRAISIGVESGGQNQYADSIAIGSYAGQSDQLPGAIAVGIQAGQDEQSTGATAVGIQAGQRTQGAYAVAVGFHAGSTSQGSAAIAIGVQAGQNTQAASAVAIGTQSGQSNQQSGAVAIGTQAGQITQGGNAVAVGAQAGQTGQGANCIAIGNLAGQTQQPANSIILNASGTSFSGTTSGSFYVNPIRNTGSTSVSNRILLFDTTTNEVRYGPLYTNTNSTNLNIFNVGTGYPINNVVNDAFHTVFNGTISGSDGGTGNIVIGGSVVANSSGSNFNTVLGYGSTVTTSDRCLTLGYQCSITGGSRSTAIGFGTVIPSGSGNVIGLGNTDSKTTIYGSMSRGGPITKTSNFTVANNENWIICNGSGTITVTLPAAASCLGREIMFKNTATQLVISNASNVIPLAGGVAGTSILPATAGSSCTMVSDGTNWIIMN